MGGGERDGTCGAGPVAERYILVRRQEELTLYLAWVFENSKSPATHTSSNKAIPTLPRPQLLILLLPNSATPW